MQIRVPAKTYGPLVVHSPTTEALTITTEAGHGIAGVPSPQAQGMSPSDLLMASVASCITLSMRMAATQMGLTLGELRAQARATKATDLPHRFATLTVEVHSAGAVPVDRQGELLERTKGLCTVSNTLGAEVVLRLSAG